MISKAYNETRVRMYALLSRSYRTEADWTLLDQLERLTFQPGPLAESGARLKEYLEGRKEDALEELAVDFARVFLAAGSAEGGGAPPCESVYTSPKGLFLQEAWEDAACRYGEKGLGKGEACSSLHEDHLALELEFMGWLVRNGSVEEQGDFLEAHLCNWVPAFAACGERYAQTGFYQALCRMTADFLALEREYLSGLASGALELAPSYSVRADRMADIFARLKEKYRIFAPKRVPGLDSKGGALIQYGEIDAIAEVAYKEKLSGSDGEFGLACLEKELEDGQKILLFARPWGSGAGFPAGRAPDLRMGEKVILLEGHDSCRCGSAGVGGAWDYSAVMRIDDICALVEVWDKALLPYFADEVPISFTPELV